VARRERIAERNRAYERRFEAELQQELSDLLSRHPPLDLAGLPPRTERVAVVAIYGGLDRGYRRHQDFLTYEDFAENARRRRESVLLEVAAAEPTLLLLLSPEPVAWEIQALGRTELTGVSVASYNISTVRGLADSVPLEIGSRAMGSLPAWFSFGTAEAESEFEDFLARTFPTTRSTVEIRRARLASLVVR
jgi:hypothetical protein